MERKHSYTIMALGAVLIAASFIFPSSMAVVLSGVFEPCDTLEGVGDSSPWYISGTGNTASVSSVSKTEGIGSLQVDVPTVTSTYGLYIQKWRYYGYSLDFTNVPKISFDFYVTRMTDSVGNLMNFYFTVTTEDNTGTSYSYDVRNQITANQWNTINVDLTTPSISGITPNRFNIAMFGITVNHAAFASMTQTTIRLDNFVAASFQTGSTPTPTITPTAQPTSTIQPTTPPIGSSPTPQPSSSSLTPSPSTSSNIPSSPPPQIIISPPPATQLNSVQNFLRIIGLGFVGVGIIVYVKKKEQ